MNEDFVSFELAVKLYNKGFDWETEYKYERNILAQRYEDVPMPTISQVLKWLREEKNISVEPCATPYNCWYYMIKCKGEIKVTFMDNKYKTYEGAAIAGIEYTLNNII